MRRTYTTSGFDRWTSCLSVLRAVNGLSVGPSVVYYTLYSCKLLYSYVHYLQDSDASKDPIGYCTDSEEFCEGCNIWENQLQLRIYVQKFHCCSKYNSGAKWSLLQLTMPRTVLCPFPNAVGHVTNILTNRPRVIVLGRFCSVFEPSQIRVVQLLLKHSKAVVKCNLDIPVGTG